MRRDDICIYVSPADRARLTGIIENRNSSTKAVWRARIILASADGHGTNAIMRLTGKSKPCVWRWQERYIEDGIEGLLRDKTRPPRIPPLSEATRLAVMPLRKSTGFVATSTRTPLGATITCAP